MERKGLERKQFEERFASLKQEAITWLPTWRDIRDYMQPTLGCFPGELPNNGRAIDHRKLLDGTPQRASDNFASGLAAHLTSPSRPWWRPTLTDLDLMEYEPVKQWLDVIKDIMYSTQNGSNIYTVLHQDYAEFGAFATSASALLEDRQDVIRGRSYTIGEYYLGVGPDGRPNAFAYYYQRTVGQLVDEYGEKNVSPSVKRLYDTNKMDSMVKCMYIIVPNKNRDPQKVDNQNLPFIAVAWEEGGPKDTFLNVSGFHEFPIMASRFSVRGNNAYGKGSPGWTCLGDAKMLQKIQRDRLIQIEKVGDPPMQADDTVDGSVITLPGGVTRTSATHPDGGVRPAYEIKPDLGALLETIQDTRMAIKEGHYENLFLMLSNLEGSGRTMREIVERTSEKMTMLGPLVERLYSEKLSPMIRRQFNIQWRAGMFPPPPPELQGQQVQIELISVLAQAQKAIGTRAIDETLTVVGEMSKFYPTVVDVIDPDQAVRLRAGMIGSPAKMLRSPDAVGQLRQARQQQEAEAAQGDKMERAAALAKTASDTKLGQGSVLDALVPGGGNQ